jgi:hypothetical protein
MSTKPKKSNLFRYVNLMKKTESLSISRLNEKNENFFMYHLTNKIESIAISQVNKKIRIYFYMST